MGKYEPSHFRVYGTTVTAAHARHGTTHKLRARRDARGRLFLKAQQLNEMGLGLCGSPRCPCRGDLSLVTYQADGRGLRAASVSAGTMFLEEGGDGGGEQA